MIFGFNLSIVGSGTIRSTEGFNIPAKALRIPFRHSIAQPLSVLVMNYLTADTTPANMKAVTMLLRRLSLGVRKHE